MTTLQYISLLMNLSHLDAMKIVLSVLPLKSERNDVICFYNRFNRFPTLKEDELMKKYGFEGYYIIKSEVKRVIQYAN